MVYRQLDVNMETQVLTTRALLCGWSASAVMLLYRRTEFLQQTINSKLWYICSSKQYQQQL